MKTHFLLFLLFLFISCSSNDDEDPVDVIVTLNMDKATVESGDSITLIPSFGNDFAAGKKYTWTSTDPGIAKIKLNPDKSANIYTTSTGVTHIKIEAEDKSTFAICEITVVNKKVFLIVVAGQSNADGRAPLNSLPSNVLEPGNKLENYMVWNKTNNSFQPYQLGANTGAENNADVRFGFDIFFAKAFIQANPTVKLYCIKQTVGGVPITEKGFSDGRNRFYRWQPKTELIAPGDKSMCLELQEKYSKAKRYAIDNNIDLISIAVLYHQGEGDADRAKAGGITDYAENLSNLKSWFRVLLSDGKLPFINGTIMHNYSPDYSLINDIFAGLCVSDKKMRTVDMSEHQTSLVDNLHYDASALQYMGTRMYDFYNDLK